MGDITTDGETPVVPVTDVLVEAGWNYHLIHYDASGGVHNSDWVNEVIEATISALSAENSEQ